MTLDLRRIHQYRAESGQNLWTVEAGREFGIRVLLFAEKKCPVVLFSYWLVGLGKLLEGTRPIMSKAIAPCCQRDIKFWIFVLVDLRRKKETRYFVIHRSYMKSVFLPDIESQRWHSHDHHISNTSFLVQVIASSHPCLHPKHISTMRALRPRSSSSAPTTALS